MDTLAPNPLLQLITSCMESALLPLCRGAHHPPHRLASCCWLPLICPYGSPKVAAPVLLAAGADEELPWKTEGRTSRSRERYSLEYKVLAQLLLRGSLSSLLLTGSKGGARRGCSQGPLLRGVPQRAPALILSCMLMV